ncbi:hypothetical protein [Haloarchaeobius iranensis]|uniref:CHAT domain-containing protein n=1 Tax=Haloarchaeobius iranensis TaxID=996166 RepID=A0A1G9Z5A3_9EURY|nr:hypothetical protein [Haloarchaeobius iranensis]SDN16549.1 hypothetical protein SAMN05192554_11826 [Haloarchaeobius iranensis]
MIEWEVTATGLRVVDPGNSEFTVEGPNLSVADDGVPLPRPVDATLSCRTDEVRFPISVVYVASESSDATYELENDTGPLELPAGEYIVDLDTDIKTYLRAEGPLAISKTPDFEEVVVSFADETEVTLGFRSRNVRPSGSITVPPTPKGLAVALSHLPASHKTTAPDRTYPTLRGHPPLIEAGDTVEVSSTIRNATPDVGIELLVPPSFDELYVTAPLAYYLQADVETVPDIEAPMLCAPGAGIRHDLGPLPDLERRTTRLLRKTFFLDCLVRNAGPYGTNLAEESLLDALDLDAEALYHGTPVDRLETYLDVPYAALEHRLPDWHLSMYVEPSPETFETIPFLLHDLAAIYMPRTSELAGSELVERSLDDFYRATGPGEVASVDVVKPELRGGRVHGWLADGVPIDVFKCTPAAYRNRLSVLDRQHESAEVTVVLNDEKMDDEHIDVGRIYREHATDLPLSVNVVDHLGTAELARVFEGENDFVHYIGHCETDGLRCPDGYLSASSLSSCGTRTFFLNACGSFHEGMELVEKGAVAGGVTFTQVLNDHAVKVGSAFARLLIHGFSFERALRIARRRIMMGKDYAVVGDGTYTLTQTTNRLPTTAELERLDDDRFFLTFDQFSLQHAGSYYHPYVEGNEYSYLCGNESEFALSKASLLEFLERADTSVIYDGEFCWSDDLYARLSNE